MSIEARATANGMYLMMSGRKIEAKRLAEVERDARADPGQLAPRERGDGEAEGRLLDDGEPAPGGHRRQARERVGVA